jgi:GT2 family glycosyltransferase
MEALAQHPQSGTRISILMSVYNARPRILNESIKSIFRQSYPNWELCICDNSSTFSETTQVLDRYRGADPRIKIIRSPGHLRATAMNVAAEFSTGHFVAFMDQHATIEPNALGLIVEAINRDTEADFLYVDEDKISAKAERTEPYLKPDWSPELLLSIMYIGGFMVVRKAIFLALNGFRAGYFGAQEYDFALRATAQARQIVHLSKLLYHKRNVPSLDGTARATEYDASTTAKRALAEFVQQKAPGSVVVDGLFNGSYRVRWPVDASRRVTLLILTDSRYREIGGRGRILLIENLVDSILKRSSYRNYTVLVLDNGALPGELRARFAKLGVIVKDYPFHGTFNFAKKLNYGFRLVETEDVIQMNDDMEVISPEWIDALLEYSRKPEIGVVGAMLLYPNDRIQHAGMILGVNGPTTHIFWNQPSTETSYCGFSHVVRNYSAVTGALHATRMSIVRQVGGLDPNLPIDYNDVDFCLRVRKAGYRIVYTPYAKLYHFENSTIFRKETNKVDQRYFMERWRNQVTCDPYYNPGLPKDRVDCRVEKW